MAYTTTNDKRYDDQEIFLTASGADEEAETIKSHIYTMPSRKRNKGKERKAKQEVAKGAWWRGWAMGQGEERCSHGCTMPPPDHAVSRFMNTFRDTLDKRIMEAMRCIFEAHPNVCNSDEHRQMAIGILLRLKITTK